MNETRRTTWGLIILAALTLAVYSFAVNGNFKTLDDEYSIVRNEKIRSFKNLPEVFTSSFFGGNSYYRPLVTVSFMKEYFFFKLNPVPYYIDNILLHIFNSLLVFVILWQITARRGISLAVAFLFALHPIQWEAVSNIPGRAILLCAFYYLAAFYCFIRSNDSRIFSYLSLVAFALALLSKESAGVLPLAIISYLYFIKRERLQNFPVIVGRLIPYAVIIGMYLGARVILGITKTYSWQSFGEMLLGFISFLRSVITDVRLLVMPIDLYFDRSQKFYLSFLEPGVYVTVGVFVFTAILVWKMRKKISPAAAFFISWFLIELFPVSQIISTVGVQPGYISTAEHFLYLPCMGFFALLVLGCDYARRVILEQKAVSQRVLTFTAFGFMAFYVLLTIQYNIYSSSETVMFERTLSINPSNTRIRNSLAMSYAKQNRFDLAEKHFRSVLNVDPFNVRARIGLGKALCDQGKVWDGIREYERINDAGNLEELLKNNLRSSLMFLVTRYEQRIQREPQNPYAYHSLGVVYSKLGDADRAIENYEKALALKADLKDSLYNLASMRDALGQRDQAIDLYEKVLLLKSGPDELDRLAAARLAVLARFTVDPRNP